MDVHTICLIGGTTLNCVLAFSISELLFLFFMLHDNPVFSFSAVPIPTISIRLQQLVSEHISSLQQLVSEQVNVKMSAIKFDIQNFDGVINFSRWQIRMNASWSRASWRKYYSGRRKSLKTWRKKLDRSRIRKSWQLFNFTSRTKCWMSFLRRKHHPRRGSDLRIIIWRSRWRIGWFWRMSLSSPHA